MQQYGASSVGEMCRREDFHNPDCEGHEWYYACHEVDEALAAKDAEIERLRAALYDAHADLGADGGVTERDCECPDCIAYRAKA